KEEGPWDLVIANDLFPNVDQRLTLFLERFLPKACEVRLSLTYYNSSRFYRVKRIDADEALCMLAWDGNQVAQALLPYQSRITAPRFNQLSKTLSKLYANDRQVCSVSLKGDCVTAEPLESR